jgi:hypothetical protein
MGWGLGLGDWHTLNSADARLLGQSQGLTGATLPGQQT